MKIEFVPSDKDVELLVPKPRPARDYIPEWYKNIKNVHQQPKSFNFEGMMTSKGIKECMPFFDAFNMGYIQETWTDIHIDTTKDELEYTYSAAPEIIRLRNKVSLEITDEFYHDEFVWRMPWLPKLPKGYSILVTHPLNHFLPFHSVSGVLDADVFYHTVFGQSPFYVKKGFSGIIPAGTPMFQLIPIKRDSWKSKFLKFNLEATLKREYPLRTVFYGAYKNMFWHRKEYN